MKKLLILSIALILASGILIAQKADGEHCGQHMMQKPMLNQVKAMKMDAKMECWDEMKLTDAQKKKFDELRTAFQKTENSLDAEIENLRIDMHTAIKAENFKQAKELNKQISAKQTALQDARLDFMAARMKELSAEQKEIMKKNLPQMMMHRKGMMNNCQGHGMMQMKHKDNCNECDDCRDNKDGMHKPK